MHNKSYVQLCRDRKSRHAWVKDVRLLEGAEQDPLAYVEPINRAAGYSLVDDEAQCHPMGVLRNHEYRRRGSSEADEVPQVLRFLLRSKRSGLVMVPTNS